MSDSDSSFLSLFKEKITIKIYPKGEKRELNIFAYRMDGNEDKNIPKMAKYTNDLSGPSCCDYLYVDGEKNKAILIEDTNLNTKVKELRDQLKGLSIKDCKTHIEKLLSQENCLKVYGSRLILCLLERRYTEISKELGGKKHSFFLVINDMQSGIKAIDNMNLKQSLKDTLGGTGLVKEIKLLPPGKLEEEL